MLAYVVQRPWTNSSGPRRLDQCAASGLRIRGEASGLPTFAFARELYALTRATTAPMTKAATEGFAGLPTGNAPPQSSGVMTAGTLGAVTASHLPSHVERSYKKFTLPRELMSSMWDSQGYTDADLEFGMTEITTEQRLRASKLAGGAKMDFQAVNLEQTYQTIYAIGGQLTNNNRGVIKRWFEAVGPKGQDIVERVFAEMTSASETEVQAVMSAGSWESG